MRPLPVVSSYSEQHFAAAYDGIRFAICPASSYHTCNRAPRRWRRAQTQDPVVLLFPRELSGLLRLPQCDLTWRTRKEFFF